MMEVYLIVGVLLTLIILLSSSSLPPALLFVSAAVIYMFAGFISPQELLTSYANETLITLLLLLQVSSVVEKTSFIPMLSRQIFKGTSLYKSLFRLTSLTMILSSHLNNTAVVASLMGIVRSNKHFSASRMLIPLSYAAIMGGVITLVGTSTNLIVNSFAIEAGLPGLHFFDFAYIGLPLAVIGLVYLIFILPHILPNHTSQTSDEEREYFVEAIIAPYSKLIGKTVAENGLRQMDHLFLAEIIRGKRLISPVVPEERLIAGDVLVFTGEISEIQELRKFDGIELNEANDEILSTNLQEVVIRHNAPIIGQRVKDAQFRTKFDAAVVAVRRGEGKLSGKIGGIHLQPGDHLVLATGKEFGKHQNLSHNFIFLTPIEAKHALTDKESYLVVAMFVMGIIIAAFELLSLFKVMVLLLLLYLMLGFMKIKHLKNNLNFSLLLMIGSSLGISAVLNAYGIAQVAGDYIIQIFGSHSPWHALAGVYLATVIITELVTNNAAAALIFPVALATANQLGVSPTPFIMAIAYGASASFITPIGYQTNTMVFSIGKYTFKDYLKGGLILSILYGVVVVWLIPYFFPF